MVRKILFTSFRIFVWLFIILSVYIFVNSSLDIYNNFAYDKAILRPTPYGYTPLISNPKFFSSVERDVMAGEYVYVIDWISAYENQVTFAKVRSRLNEGYINRALLVEANFNPKPLASILFLCFILYRIARKVFLKFKNS